MRLSYLLELVLAVAVGLALARFRMGGIEWINPNGIAAWMDWSEALIDDVLAGAFLVGGLGTVVERLRGRSPRVWGPGRWAWVALAAFVLLTTIDNVLISITIRRQTLPPDSITEAITNGLQRPLSELPFSVAAFFVLSASLAWLLAPAPSQSPKADAREWAGRVLAALLVVAMLIVQSRILIGGVQDIP